MMVGAFPDRFLFLDKSNRLWIAYRRYSPNPDQHIMMNAPANHLPSDHPEVRFGKVGVLLVNLGTPDGTDYWSMRRYWRSSSLTAA